MHRLFLLQNDFLLVQTSTQRRQIAMNADPRNPGYKQNVLYGLSKAQVHAHSPNPIKIFEVRTHVIHGSSRHVADFTRTN